MKKKSLYKNCMYHGVIKFNTSMVCGLSATKLKHFLAKFRNNEGINHFLKYSNKYKIKAFIYLYINIFSSLL